MRILVLLVVFAVPMPVLAQSTVSLPADTVIAQTAQDSISGVTRPAGASADTYTYNGSTGLWENDYYSWNPVTKETTPKNALEYTYNIETGLWDTKIWEYHPVIQQYDLVPVSVTSPPEGATLHGGPPAPQSLDVVGVSASSTPNLPAEATSTASNGLAQANNLEPTILTPSGTDTGVVGVSNATDVMLNTVIVSAAQTGNADLLNNTTAGNATTGSATASATVINLLQSSASLTGSGLALFTTDIHGDVSGNLLIDPSSFVQPATANASDLSHLTLQNKFDGSIVNDINLSAISGNATISGNRDAGNAATGTAEAVANVINMINSVVAANQSFLGVINIYGNYSGDILVPTDTLQALLASNKDNGNAGDADTSLATTSNQQITNNTNLAAISGETTVTGNTRAGTATTGDALTKLTIFNLTGGQVTAKNSLLVFVNVLGTWVGVIMNAPSGSTAVVLADGSAESSNQDAEQGQNMDIVDNATSAITNNISATARSGNATVTDNTRVGDASTGRATASASIFNLMNSSMSLSNWFGILFINVFGSWHGSFGAAKPPVVSENATGGTTVGGGRGGGFITQTPQLFRFDTSSTSRLGLSRLTPASFSSQPEYEQYTETVNEVLAANDIVGKVRTHQAVQSENPSQFRFSLLPIALGITGLTVVGTEKIRSIRRRVIYHLGPH